MIKLTNINKYYSSSEGKFHALKDITLTLPDQGMVYVVGKSGSGKSTLLNVIGGIDNYDSGELIIENSLADGTIQTIDTKKFTKKDYNAYRNTYIGFIFQEFNVVKGLTVYENIALPLELQQLSVKENHQAILDILAKVGLQGKEKRRINELSGGERQRVAIARALIKNPKVIIADEPTGNLDSKNRDMVMDILKELSKDKLVLIVTHDKYLAERYGDRELSLKDGVIIGDRNLHEENIKNIVLKENPIKSINPKAYVSLRLAWKGFKLNKLRFIFIILLFMTSLVFAGTVFNLYLTNTTKEYAVYQKDYGNYVVSLSEDYNYFGTNATTGFYTYDLNKAKSYFTTGDASMTCYTSMLLNLDISKNDNGVWEDLHVYHKSSIDNIIIFEDTSTLKQEFSVGDEYYTTSKFTCYITDYLAYSLYYYNYFNESSLTPYTISGTTISIPGMINKLTIIGIIETNFRDFINNPDFSKDAKLQAAFNDNLAMYNALYISKEVYNLMFQASNVQYFTDDVLYNKNDVTKKFNDVTFSYPKTSTKIYNDGIKNYGNLPLKPKQGEITQIAVSKGFLEQVLGLSISSISFVNGSNNTELSLTGSISYHFRICGVRRIPMSFEFVISGITDDYYLDSEGNKVDKLCVYAPATTESNLYQSFLNTSFVNGGFLTTKISDDVETNSEVYRNLLNNDITITNPSFLKLQLVDTFIRDNIYLFAALFFSFCLFSILMIFNFIIINIKNSTRDIGIYMSLGMNGFRISLIYLFQVLIISTISVIVGIIGSSIFLHVMDANFSSQAAIDFKILKNNFFGIGGVILLGYLTPLIAIISPLLSLSRKKPVDVIKQS